MSGTQDTSPKQISYKIQFSYALQETQLKLTEKKVKINENKMFFVKKALVAFLLS